MKSSMRYCFDIKQIQSVVLHCSNLHVALVLSKFADGLPLYRQQKIFNRLGIDLSCTTIANWVVNAARQCHPLIDAFVKSRHSGENRSPDGLQLPEKTGFRLSPE
jgi:transposase